AEAPPQPVPTLVQTIGRSVTGRPIRVVRRGADDAAVDVLIVGVIHGNERAGLDVLRQLRYATPPAGVRLWLIPTVNPDGERRRTRQNARGVDLNRNYPGGWQPIGSPWQTYYPGRAAASEPETRAVQALVRRVRPDVTLWYHQHANRVIRPAGGWSLIVARSYARTSRLPLLSWPPLRGTATGWQRAVDPTSAPLVIELPAGPVRGAPLRRHVAAVWDVARLAVAWCAKDPRRCR
ncbi:MAG: murein peptide amidase, partial [Thermoleophilia bacterium]|nr:murein peptide amidase [Thermoleophilia bacterium]